VRPHSKPTSHTRADLYSTGDISDTIDTMDTGGACMYRVERNTGIPPARRNAPKYPWRQMNVRDSFLVPVDDPAYDSIRCTAKKTEQRTRHRYSVRQVQDDHGRVFAMRITRVA